MFDFIMSNPLTSFFAVLCPVYGKCFNVGAEFVLWTTLAISLFMAGSTIWNGFIVRD